VTLSLHAWCHGATPLEIRRQCARRIRLDLNLNLNLNLKSARRIRLDLLLRTSNRVSRPTHDRQPAPPLPQPSRT
jgi:hypothetical protein